jgi:hypothetical protein
MADISDPKCVFCGAPWGEAQLKDLIVSQGEGSYYFGVEAYSATIEIHCSECKRLVYSKDVRDY